VLLVCNSPTMQKLIQRGGPPQDVDECFGCRLLLRKISIDQYYEPLKRLIAYIGDREAQEAGIVAHVLSVARLYTETLYRPYNLHILRHLPRNQDIPQDMLAKLLPEWRPSTILEHYLRHDSSVDGSLRSSLHMLSEMEHNIYENGAYVMRQGRVETRPDLAMLMLRVTKEKVDIAKVMVSGNFRDYERETAGRFSHARAQGSIFNTLPASPGRPRGLVSTGNENLIGARTPNEQNLLLAMTMTTPVNRH